jgi:orotidine-5'-phosphate decarboxylase
MTRKELVDQIKTKGSFLCIGLDPDLNKIPPHLLDFEDPIFEFNKALIEATHDICVAYKPNIAFYEALGRKGWESLEKTMSIIPDTIFTIADAKRGDIGNTSKMYAKTFFEYLPFDAVTVAPYMGVDSVSPFLEYEEKWVILLALTSNQGSNNFQRLESAGKPIWQHVVEQSQEWGSPSNLMYVVGATHGSDISMVREVAKEHFILVPGVGAQGGDFDAVVSHGINDDIGLLINSAREIIYAGKGKDFAAQARLKALELQSQMALIVR